MDLFIRHVITNRLRLSMWYMELNGELNLYSFYCENNQWKREKDFGIAHITENDIKLELSNMLTNYDYQWDKLRSCNTDIILSYGYNDNEEETPLLPEYTKPTRSTCFASYCNKETIKKLNITMHKKYTKEIRKYNHIRKAVYEEIQRINPDRKIDIILDDNPSPIAYIVC